MRRILTLIVALCTAAGAMADTGGKTKTVYSRMTANATGQGLVYVATSATDSPTLNASSSQATNQATIDEGQEADPHTYYLYAQAADGHYFAGWYSNSKCTNLISEQEACTVTLQTSSTNENAPTEGFAYALFNQITHTYYSHLTAHCTGDGKGTISVTTAPTDAPAYSQQGEAKQQSASQRHTYRLYAQVAAGYVFTGWYKDEACTQLISLSAEATYSVTAEATTEAEPSRFTAYARFMAPGNEVYQVPNAGFEDWEEIGGGNQEPVNWSSFCTATGSMVGMAGKNQINPSDDCHSGARAAHIWSRSIVGVVAQGNLTSGCINAGSMTASDASGNYNYTRVEQPGQAMKFTGRPDAIRVWVKSKTAGSFKIAAILHSEGFYQDPFVQRDGMATLIGQAESAPANNREVWTEYVVPFTYHNTDHPAYALISFATSNTPGGGASGDLLWVDDITMEYYSEIEAATFQGQRLHFNADGQANCAADYDPALLLLTLKGAGATATTDYDEEARQLTIIVMGDNIVENPANQHRYTIQFGAEEHPTPLPQGTYAINMEPDQQATNANRRLHALTLTEVDNELDTTLETDPQLVYNDLSEEVIEVDPMAHLEINAQYADAGTYAGLVWMHPYLYLDYDQDGEFQVYEDKETHVVDGDIPYFGFYSFSVTDDSHGWDCMGNSISGDDRASRYQNQKFPMGFLYAPEQPGYYRLRAKIDWNSVDPAGSLGEQGNVSGKNGIVTNGGYIVDLTIRVRGQITGLSTIRDSYSASKENYPASSENYSASRNSYSASSAHTIAFDLQGRAVSTNSPAAHRHGLLIQNGQKRIK